MVLPHPIFYLWSTFLSFHTALYGCLPDNKENLCRVVKKSAASLYSALFV
jgi:hypothetical protein